MIKIRLKLGPFLSIAARPPRPRGAQRFCMLLVRPPGNVVAASLELQIYDAALSVGSSTRPSKAQVPAAVPSEASPTSSSEAADLGGKT